MDLKNENLSSANQNLRNESKILVPEVKIKRDCLCYEEERRSQYMETLKNRIRNICSLQTLKKKIPIFGWLPKYTSEDLLGDFIAGLTVGLTVIPQGIAYALIAGLPPNYGLYSAFLGSFIYVIFGSCKDITIGPTAIMAFLTYEYANGDPDIAILLSFTSGVFVLACGIFNLGFLIALISKPVISAFTSAAAIAILSSQFKGLFGLKFSSHGFVDTWSKFGSHFRDTRWQDLSLGLSCIVMLLSLRGMKDVRIFRRNSSDTFTKKIFKILVNIICVGRNAFVVVLASVLSGILDKNQPFIITGEIEAGLPGVSVPAFSGKNGTEAFADVMSDVGAGLVILPLISILESIAIASAFAEGRAIDASQEMIALGVSNLLGSFVKSMPTTGSFSRTAVNSTSGVRTPAGGIVTGCLVILALAFLTQYFKYIPISSMSAVIICAVVFMVDPSAIRPILSVSHSDHLVLWVTFIVCLAWKLELGILFGISINIVAFLISESIPNVDVDFSSEVLGQYPSHIVVRPNSGLQFLNAERIRRKISESAVRVSGNLPVVVDCSRFKKVDYTGSKVVQALTKDFGIRNQVILFCEATPAVYNALKAICPEINILDRNRLKQVLLELLCNCNSNDCLKCSPEIQQLYPPNQS